MLGDSQLTEVALQRPKELTMSQQNYTKQKPHLKFADGQGIKAELKDLHTWMLH